MEIATMSRFMGRFILAVFAGLIPASRPFHEPKDRPAAVLPLGTFVQESLNRDAVSDSLTIERRGRDYRLTFDIWNADPVECDAQLFQSGSDHEGLPNYFLDLKPRLDRPARRHGLPDAAHLAAKVRWTIEGDKAWLSFETVNEEWLEDNKTRGLATPELRKLLKKALRTNAFTGQARLGLRL